MIFRLNLFNGHLIGEANMVDFELNAFGSKNDTPHKGLALPILYLHKIWMFEDMAKVDARGESLRPIE
jgi:hypothetical protein